MSKLPREPREVTPEGTYVRRRELIRNAAAFLGTAAIGGGALTVLARGRVVPKKVAEAPLPAPVPGEFMPEGLDIKKNPAFEIPDKTPLESITHYNNYYELGYSKDEPSENASELVIRPWTVAFEGEIAKPQTVDIDTLLRWFPLEERVYRMRCVETWSMVIPWMGFPLGELIKRLEPTSRAKYVAFETLYRPGQMPGQKRDVLEWPYVEGLRIDEATNPLTLMAVGLYGRSLPRQNGAPMRLVVPWKYGFKGIKAIVKMRFLEREPKTTWNIAAPNEYGFYANVNPAVPHPRWSQATERRVGETERRPTLPFNGYAEQVASLYDGMDLKRRF